MARQVPECAPAHASRARARAARGPSAAERQGSMQACASGQGAGRSRWRRERRAAAASGRLVLACTLAVRPRLLQRSSSGLGALRSASLTGLRMGRRPCLHGDAARARRPSAARRPPRWLRRRGERARAVTTVFGSLDLGSAIGLLICGPLINAFGWPSVFWLFALLGLAWCLAWPLVRPEEPDPAVARGSSPAPASGPKRARPSAPSPCTPGLPHACGLICGPERARPSAPLFHAHPAHHVLWPRPAAPPCRRSCARATWPL